MNILTIYARECKERYTPLGFRRIRQTYARIVNDVLQTFTFMRCRTGHHCRVEFGVFPLCQALEYADLGLYRLDDFEVSTYLEDWYYDNHSEDSMNACVQQICSYIDHYLLPFFDKANCSKNALPALIALDEHIHYVRQTHLQQRGIKDRAKLDWRYASLLKYEKFFMALKCGQYDYAREAAQVLIPKSRPEYQKLYRSIIDHLDAEDMAYIENILYEREQESLKNLGKDRLKPSTNFDPNELLYS